MPEQIDHGQAFDYSRASTDYAAYRPVLPEELFAWLRTVGIGLPRQRILDLGTGTELVARRLARAGCSVSAIDISEGQIAEARRLSQAEGLTAHFYVASAETPPFAERSFDAAAANQSFLYFDAQQAFAALRRVLVPQGLLALSQFRRAPDSDPIAAASDALIKKYNPSWGANDFGGGDLPFKQWLPDTMPAGYVSKHQVRFDLHVPFTRASWRGRIRATRGVGASLSAEQVQEFDREHERLLEALAPPEFAVKHRMEALVLQVIDG